MATAPSPITLRHAVKKMPGAQQLIDLSVVVEDRWFDFYYRVDTSTQIEEQRNLGWPADKVNHHYLPIRPKCARRVLRDLPLKICQEHTFIDFGSGKGRMLFLAASHGFRRVLGIELREELHRRAIENFRECRNLNGCVMDSVQMDAAEYDFPKENLVLFFFNPFGSEVMTKVLGKLSASLELSFRDVWVILHNPACAYLADSMSQLQLRVSREGYRIYRSIPAAVSQASKGQR